MTPTKRLKQLEELVQRALEKQTRYAQSIEDHADNPQIKVELIKAEARAEALQDVLDALHQDYVPLTIAAD